MTDLPRAFPRGGLHISLIPFAYDRGEEVALSVLFVLLFRLLPPLPLGLGNDGCNGNFGLPDNF